MFRSICLIVLLIFLIVTPNAANAEAAAKQPFSLSELKHKLGNLIHQKYPDARVDERVNPVIISFRSDVYKAHITKDMGNSSEAPSRCFPSDFKEFLFYIYLNHDQTFFRQPRPTREVSTSFGARRSLRYNVQVLLADPNFIESDLSFIHWANDDLNKLVYMDVMEQYRQFTFPSLLPITRIQAAIAVARLLDRTEERKKDTPEVKKIIAKLAVEFAPELAKLGASGLIDKDALIKQLADKGIQWQPRYAHLDVYLNYGKGFDKKLRKKVEGTIARYAAAWLQSNSSAKDGLAKR